MRPSSAGGNVPPNFHQVDIPDEVRPDHQLQGYGHEGRIQVSLADLIGLIQGGGIDISNVTFVTFNDETSTLPNSLHFATSSTIEFTQVGNTVIAEVIDFPDINFDDVLFTQNQVVLGRNSAGPGPGQELPATTVLDWIGATRGSILYRGASAWSALTPGTNGYLLQTGGAGADPSWVAPAAAGAPTDADYLVKTANGSLSAERVVTDTSTITWDWSTPGQAKANAVNPIESIILGIGDLDTAITTGTAKGYYRMPYAFTVTDVRASLKTAQTGGSTFTVDVKESGSTILSTPLTIDNGEKTSTTAATPKVVSDASLADDAEMTFDVTQVGDGTAKGLIVTIIGRRT